MLKRLSIVAATASPMDPPTCRKSELSPVASAIRWRGMLESDTVVSGTKRQAKPTPCVMSAMMTPCWLVSNVKWLIS